jgi:hypothetical protein
MDFSIQLLPEQPLTELIEVMTSRTTMFGRWSCRRLNRLPDLASQLELFRAQVVPALAAS